MPTIGVSTPLLRDWTGEKDRIERGPQRGRRRAAEVPTIGVSTALLRDGSPLQEGQDRGGGGTEGPKRGRRGAEEGPEEGCTKSRFGGSRRDFR